MPAHIKSSLVGHQLMLPITDEVLNLGMWLGIYLREYRVNTGPRDVFVTIKALNRVIVGKKSMPTV